MTLLKRPLDLVLSVGWQLFETVDEVLVSARLVLPVVKHSGSDAAP